MKKALDLQKDNINQLFFNFLVPAILSGVVTSLYIIVDGIFIGKGIGSQGLAAVGLVVPMFTMFNGLSMIFGIGGSTYSAIYKAQSDQEKANQYFSQSVYCITLIMAIFTLTVFVFRQPILIMFGAQGQLLELSTVYLGIMIVFGIPNALALVLSMFVRIEGFPKLAMVATLLGAFINVVFDYIFIFKFDMGVFGAGLATGLGNIIATFIMLYFFIKKKGSLRFTFKIPGIQVYKNIFSVGLPNFMNQMFISVITIVYNLRLLSLIGESGVSAFSAIGFLIPFLIMIFLGVTQALQPIISSNYGTKQVDRINGVVSISTKVSLAIGGTLALIGIFLSGPITSMFISPINPAYEIAVDGLPYYFVSYIFIGITLVYSTYFQSIEQPKYALYLSILRGFVFIMPLMYILSEFIGVKGMWYAMFASEILTCLVAMLYKGKIKMSNSETTKLYTVNENS